MSVQINPDLDTSEYIFNWQFHVSLPMIGSTSIEYLRVFGTHITGDRNIDKELNNQFLEYWKSIAELTELYKEGITIKFLNKEDTKTVYDFVSAHLNAWNKKIQYEINIEPPLDDLIDLDNFAHAIYEHAKYQIKPEDNESPLIKRMKERNLFNMSNIFKTNPNMVRFNSSGTSLPDVTPEIPERESLAGLFSAKRFGRQW